MSKDGDLSVLGLSGSLRRDSLNTKLLKAAQELVPDGLAITLFDLAEIPLYNEDVRQEGLPASVVALRRAISEADALLITTPEYNYSIPGVLKNAIDWASRPPDQPFAGKAVAIMGASPSRLGTARAQYHLRQVFVFLDSLVLNKPEVMVSGADKLFDGSGRLSDQATRDFVQAQLEALAAWAWRLKASA